MGVGRIGGQAAQNVGSGASGGTPAVKTGASGGVPAAKVVRGSAPRTLTPLDPVGAASAPATGAPTKLDAKAAAYLRAMQTEPAAKLEKTLAAARKENPVAYRAALREFTREHVGAEVSRLKIHTMAMDGDNDGWLTFGESYKAMHDMGFHPVRAFLLSGLTSLLLAPQSQGGKLGFKVDVANADRTERPMFKNGFDTAEALEKRLDDVMAEDKDGDGFVTLEDLHRMVDKRTAKMESKLGAKALNYLNKGEWQALVSLMEGERMNRDELRDFYRGSLFLSFLQPDDLAKKLVAYRSGEAPALKKP